VPNVSKPLKAKPPKVRPPGFTDGAWAFPARLADLANKRGWYAKDIVRIADVTQGTVSKWIRYMVEQPDPAKVRRIEIEAKIPVGTLLREPGDGIVTPRDVVSTQLEEWAFRVGIDQSVVATLNDEKLGAAMNQFSPQVRGAILGLVHLHRVPLQRAIDIARGVVKTAPKFPKSREPNELYWYSQMVPLVGTKKESGEFPSSSHIKIAE
jgi:transcriptional regulator with XRE-family HTH domain